MVEPDGELLPGCHVQVKAPEPPASYKWSMESSSLGALQAQGLD